MLKDSCFDKYISLSSSLCQKYLIASFNPNGSFGVICFKFLNTSKNSLILIYFLFLLFLYLSNSLINSFIKSSFENFSLTSFIAVISFSSIFSWTSSINLSVITALTFKSMFLSWIISNTIFLLCNNCKYKLALISL